MENEDFSKLMYLPAPEIWKNAQCKHSGREAKVVVETRLYSDSWFLGEYRTDGPISVLNGLPSRLGSRYQMLAALILRFHSHLPQSFIRHGVRSDYAHYHGGSVYDEVAALVSLILDVRIMSGKPEREFRSDDDPFGRPKLYDRSHEPIHNYSRQHEQIPRLHRDVDLSELSRLSNLENISAENAVALIKAARLYQKALWIANDSPETAWLFLVSAAETVALRYDDAQVTPTLPPQVEEILISAGVSDLAPRIASALRIVSAPTGKFVRFLINHLPKAPEVRPPYSTFNFSRDSMRKAAGKIYSHRSNVLHNGTAFPAPMCFAPDVFDNGSCAEVPFGLATHTLGSSWSSEDTPMLLGTFSYIVRGALIAWWDEICAQGGDLG